MQTVDKEIGSMNLFN
jgi:hypothetical protein